MAVSSNHVYLSNTVKGINQLPWSLFLTNRISVFISHLLPSITERVSGSPAAQTKEIVILGSSLCQPRLSHWPSSTAVEISPMLKHFQRVEASGNKQERVK